MKDKFADYKGANGNYQLNCLLNDAQSGVRGMIEHIKNGDCYDKYLESLVRYDELLDFAIENTDFSPKPDKQEKPKRVKVEHVKVEAPCDFFDLKSEFRKEQLFFKNNNGNYEAAVTLVELVAAFEDLNLYRKAETEIDERQEFIEEVERISECIANEGGEWSFACLASVMFDSGFKLVNDK